MNIRLWAKRFLYGIFLLGTATAVALWIAAKTARCEGFGCLGVGAIAGMAFVVQLVCVIAGGILIWVQRPEGAVPNWLLALEALHALPVLWFAGLMLLS